MPAIAAISCDNFRSIFIEFDVDSCGFHGFCGNVRNKYLIVCLAINESDNDGLNISTDVLPVRKPRKTEIHVILPMTNKLFFLNENIRIDKRYLFPWD